MLGAYIQTSFNYLIVFSVFFITNVHARRRYQDRIPNADSVPDPCRERNSDLNPIWESVGHMRYKDPKFALNAFGQDFLSNGLVFTRAFCLGDSDGDGVPNYKELGLNETVCHYTDYFVNFYQSVRRLSDKNLVRGHAAYKYMKKNAVSHPGICEYNRPSCKEERLRAERACPGRVNMVN